MTPGFAVLALLALLLVVLPALALILRVVGTRLLGRGAREMVPAGEELAGLGELQLAGFATDAQLAALTARERRFVARVAAPHIAAGGQRAARWADAPYATKDAVGSRRAAEREVPVLPFLLVCPACGASLGAAADVAHYVGSCPGCSRRVASRRRGARISLTALETIRPPE